MLTFAKPPVLPKLVKLPEMLPDRVSAERWSQIPLGIGPTGAEVGIDLELGPHALVVGTTGSGKTVEISSHIAEALVRGHSLVVIDPVKGVDFELLRPWASIFADTVTEAAAAVERLLDELQRRKAVLKECGVVKWSDLPAAVQDAEKIRPITIVVDEFGDLVQLEPVPKGLPKGHPYVVAAEEANGQRAMVMAGVNRLAATARFVGLHLIVGTQRMDSMVGDLATRLRSNCTSRIQLCKPGSPASADDLKMVFPAQQVAAAGEVLTALDDGHSRGLAVVAAEGGGVAGFRVAYAPMADLAKTLEELRVPHAVPLPKIAKKVPTTAEAHGFTEVEHTPVVTDLGEFELTAEDLDLFSSDDDN